MDMTLEKMEEEKLVAEYRSQRQLTKHNRTDNVFTSLRTFFSTLSNDVENGTLITKIVESYTPDDIKAITDAIQRYFDENKVSDKDKKNYFNGIMAIANLVQHYIRNIYSQLLNPSIKTASYIEYLSYSNFKSHFKRTMLSVKISYYLLSYINEYKPILDNMIKKYLVDIIDDIINVRYVAKLSLEIRDNSYEEYHNEYYMLLYSDDLKIRQSGEMRLPKGMGFVTNVKLDFAIDENPQNNFTYEECRDWVSIPIVNPRTFKSILIDSPIYNRLLCMSYQYDNNLIPRMITSKGKHLLFALYDTIKTMLEKTRDPPQTREELEKYIRETSKFDVKFKIVGTTQPKYGREIINTKMRIAFIKLSSSNGQLPFYVFLTKKDLRKFGITTEIAKDSYIKIEDIKGRPYYYAIVNTRRESREIINTPIVIVKRTDYSKFDIIYSISECERWMQEVDILSLIHI